MTLLQSSSTCWAIAVNDYGAIISTLLALATFASLFFLAYILHRTLASRTPKNKQRNLQAEKQKRKKRRHGSNHTRGRGGGRIKSNHAQQHGPREGHTDSRDSIVKVNEEEHNRGESKTQPLPPLAEDEPVATSEPVPPLHSSTTATLKEEDPQLRDRATSTSTLDSSSSGVSSCGTGSGRSTPTPAVANETQPSNLAALERHPVDTTLNRMKAKNVNARRPQNNRRGKKSTDVSGGHRLPVATPPVPSRRWDALKPANRTNNRQRHNNPASSGRHARDDHIASIARYSKRGDSLQQNRSIRNAASFPFPTSPERFAGHDSATSISFDNDGFGNSVFTGSPIRNTYSSNSKAATSQVGYLSSRPSTASAACHPSSITSDLNAESPSWTERGIGASAGGTPIRPPPGLESIQQHDIPFGCSSSDGGMSAPASPFRGLPSALEVHLNESDGDGFCSATSSPFRSTLSAGNPSNEPSMLSNYEGMSLPPDSSSSSLPCRPLPGCTVRPYSAASQRPHVKENPFASSDDDEDQIEAELQELGGQMVGSILDF